MDIWYRLGIADIVADRVRAKRTTVIAALHNLNLAATYCDKLIFMRSDRIVSEGNIDAVLNSLSILKQSGWIRVKLKLQYRIRFALGRNTLHVDIVIGATLL
nr:hypothetical protein [Desulfobacterales bacterium]